MSSSDISFQSAVLVISGEGYFFRNSQSTGIAILPSERNHHEQKAVQAILFFDYLCMLFEVSFFRGKSYKLKTFFYTDTN